jgi:hypothetical protein
LIDPSRVVKRIAFDFAQSGFSRYQIISELGQRSIHPRMC